MVVRRVLAVAAALATVVCLISASPAQAQSSGQKLVFRIALHPVSGGVHELPGGVSYGQSQLAGTTKWAGRSAKVEWMCSHVSTNGAGPAHDLVTIKRSDGAVLALAVNGRISNDTLRGKVEVIGGSGAFSGATGVGTVVGRTGAATITVNVSKSVRTRNAATGGVGC